jgi:hypothetical protein
MGAAIGIGLVVFVAGIVLLIAFTMREARRYMERLTAIVATQGRRRAAGGDRADPGS